jgi:3-deoxy-D-manno-octulosonate 8-phosphate phosphatase (KDO 8-P phosphatase)
MTTRKKTHLTKTGLAKKLAGIKALILDVDGVLTDDSLYIGPDGFELKRFHIGDGLSIVLAMRAGLEVIILSNRHSLATTTRMKDLGVKHVIQARGDKLRLITEYIEKKKMKFGLSEIAYMGNDIMDVSLVRKACIGVAVKDAYPGLTSIADYVTTKKGGHGAVREVIDLYFKGSGLNPAEMLYK